MSVMTLPANLDQLTADELRELVCQQAEVITRNDRELNWRQAKIDKLTHEVATTSAIISASRQNACRLNRDNCLKKPWRRTWRR